MLAPIHRSGGVSLIDILRTLAATAGATRLARSYAGHRRVNGISLCILAMTAALLAACGGGSANTPPSPPPVARPGAPTGITVSAGNNQVSISWGAVAGATSYNIYRSTTAGQQGSSVGTSVSASFVDTTAVNGTTYLYEVTAVNAGGAVVEPAAPLQVSEAKPLRPEFPNAFDRYTNGGTPV